MARAELDAARARLRLTQQLAELDAHASMARLTAAEASLEAVAARYAVAITPDMLGLIDRDDADDPIARQVVADGEGATVVLEIGVNGAASTAEAEAIARRIATSPLVKTAAFGHDPNWGRVLMAAGSAPHGDGFAELDTERLTVAFGGVAVFADGSPTGSVPELVGPVCRIDLELGLGDGSAAYLTTDLSFDYVRINAEYRS